MINEEDYKKRYANEQSTSKVDQENLWDSISSELDEIEVGGAVGGSYKWVALAAILLGAISFYYMSSIGSESDVVVNSGLENIEVEKESSNHSVISTNDVAKKHGLYESSGIASDEVNHLSEAEANEKANLSGNEISLYSINHRDSKNGNSDVIYSEDTQHKVSTESDNSNHNALIGSTSLQENTGIDNASIIDHKGENDQVERMIKVHDEKANTVPDDIIAPQKDEYGNAIDVRSSSGSKGSNNEQKTSENREAMSLMSKEVDNTGFTQDETSIVDAKIKSKNEVLVISRKTEQNKGIGLMKMFGVRQDKSLLPLRLKNNTDDKDEFYNQKFIPITIGVYSGVNTMLNTYTSNTNRAQFNNELKNAYTNNYGVVTSVKLGYDLNRNITIGTGLDYTIIRSRFDVVRKRNTTVSYGEQLVSFDIDPITGDSINLEYKEILADAIETRTVVHHNQHKLISIPIEVGFKGRIRATDFGLNVGLSYNVFQSQSGKSINSEGEIIAFNGKSETGKTFGKSFVGFHISPFVERRLGDKFSAQLHSTVKYQDHGFSNFHGLDQSSILLYLQLGLVYNW